jgi:hypothetical protein
MWLRFRLGTRNNGEHTSAWQEVNGAQYSHHIEGMSALLETGQTIRMEMGPCHVRNVPANEVTYWDYEIVLEEPNELSELERILEKLPTVMELATEYEIHFKHQMPQEAMFHAAEQAHMLLQRSIIRRRGLTSGGNFPDSP